MKINFKMNTVIAAVSKRKYVIVSTLMLLGIVIIFQNCGSTLPATTTNNQTAPTPTPVPTSNLMITPGSTTVVVGGTVSFYATGGAGNYVYSVASGTGTINASSGFYTAPNAVEVDQINVTDSAGNSSAASVSVTTTSGPTPTVTATPVHGPAPSITSTGWVTLTNAVWANGVNIQSNCQINIFTPHWTASGISGFANPTQIAQISGGSTNCSPTFLSFTLPAWIKTAFPGGINYNVNNADGQWSEPVFVAY